MSTTTREPPQPTGRTLPLTKREKLILTAFGKGLTSREIAQELSLSVKTVEAHRYNIRIKLGLPSAHALTVHAVRLAHGVAF